MALTETEELELLELEEEEAMAKMAAPSPERPDLNQRISGIAQNYVSGKISAPEGALQSMGETARPVNEAVGNVVGAVARPAIKAGSWMLSNARKLPQPIKTALKLTTPGLAYEASKAIMPAAAAAGQAYQGFEKAHPRLAADIGAAGQIAGVAGLGLGAAQLMKAGAPAAGEALQGFAKKGRQIAWKPAGTPEQVAGKLDIAAKSDIWGKAKPAAVQTKQIIGQKYKVLKEAIAEKSGEQGAIVDPVALIDQAETKALANASPTSKKSVANAFKEIRDATLEKYGDRKIDLADAQLYKQQLGEWADDAFDVTKKGKAVSAQSGKHQAYIHSYDEFKTSLENLGPPGVKEQNQELSKLLELRRDMRKRASVQERNNFMPLDEVVLAAEAVGSAAAGHIAPALLYGANVASKMGSVGRAAYGTGAMLKKVPKAMEWNPLKKTVIPKPATAPASAAVNAKPVPRTNPAVSDVSAENPFWNLPKTKKEAVALNLGSSEEISPDMAEVIGGKRLTPEEYDAMRMGQSDVQGTIWDKSVKGGIGAKTVQSLKRSFGIPTSSKFEVGDFSKLDPAVQGKISSYVNDFNQALENDLPRWNTQYGAAGFPKEHIDPDEVVRIMNQGGTQSGSAAIGPLAGSAAGSVGGASAGSQIGNTPEERSRNMLIGAGLGAIGGAALGRLIPASVIRGLSTSERGALTLPGGVAAHTGDEIADKLGVVYNGVHLGANDEPLFMLFTDHSTRSTFAAKSLDEAYRKYRAMTDAFAAAGKRLQ